MSFELRPYQQTAVDAAISYLKKSRSPAILDLCVAAGKSIIVSEIANWLVDKSGKKVLCLQPNKELTEQNYEAWLETGNPASIWCAGLGKKTMNHDVVFATPRSVANNIEKFGDQFSGVVIDEAHAHKKVQIEIVDAIRKKNPNVRVLGVTGTAYRLGDGFIFRTWQDGKPVGEDACKDPYYERLLYQITVPELLEMGYLTPPLLDVPQNLVKSTEVAREGLGNKTSEIISQIVELSSGRKGVMIFGQTIDHCKEIMMSLPEGDARLVTGETNKKDRDKAVSDFKEQKYKYLVSQGIFTTGFNATHIDCLGILRRTESRGLFQQIIGRGLRLHDKKENCLILDYAENIEAHGLEDDLFKPEIKANWRSGEQQMITAACETCLGDNLFSARPNKEEYGVDENGYFTDLTGDRIINEGQPIPAHFGRRCTYTELIKGDFVRCSGRWSFKTCPECESEENDIAARKCSECGALLVDPNEKLKLDFKRMKISAREKSSDKVVSWFCQSWVSQKGNESLRVDWTTEYRSFSAWYSPDSRTTEGQGLWSNLSKSVFNGRVAPTIDKFVNALKKGHGTMPSTITSKKEGDFFKIYAHNEPEDVLNEIQ